jgi:hypothetical protein
MNPGSASLGCPIPSGQKPRGLGAMEVGLAGRKTP